jgi:uncharacterized membrane-anchored protein YitT (DUF2179 family)
MTVGLFIFVFSWTAFLIPNEIAGGGVSGLASVIKYATGFEVSYSYIIINLFLLGGGFLILGKGFGFKTIYCIIVATLLFRFLPMIPWVSDIEDKLINALLGGTLSGIGIGMIFLQGGSTGGTDIVALIVAKFRETSPGRVFLYCDLVIIGSVIFIPGKSLSDVIYGYIEMVSFSYVIDLILTGNKQSVQVLIFSSKYSEIADRTVKELGRGVTALTSTGWYTQKESRVLVVVLRKTEVAEITRLVKEIDRDAFLSVTPVMSVYGRGFDQIKSGKISWKKEKEQ